MKLDKVAHKPVQKLRELLTEVDCGVTLINNFVISLRTIFSF